MATKRDGKAGVAHLDPCEARRLIEAAEQEDLARARHVINGALEEAGRQWIPLGATAMALAFALGELTNRAGSAAGLADALDRAAAQLRASPGDGGLH
ncbi:hypothetical protein [Phenylobacterium sp.]|uniref:hypothetical protein n=1 Tax=Phenylobacterium sp. TaxID=1871053 RepID=UPI00273140C7|nr:hypothetical protein [Phenylobacterium sp.]MDP1875735.1 hypothetical protein [Phenylobacterium sp.]